MLLRIKLAQEGDRRPVLRRVVGRASGGIYLVPAGIPGAVGRTSREAMFVRWADVPSEALVDLKRGRRG